MVLNAVPKNREEMDANGSKLHSFPTGRAMAEEGVQPPRPSIHAPKPPISTHSELPIFTILYNKYSDGIR